MSKLIGMKNHFKIEGDKAIVYSNGKNKQLTFIIDVADLNLIKDYSWRVYHLSNGYKRVETSILAGKKHIILARLLMNFPDGKYIDHVDCDPTNNQRSNLRLASEKENSRNAAKTKRKTSSNFKGVSWHKHKNKWIAMCAVNGKNTFIGYFSNEIEAAKAYDLKAKELHGEFAKTNFPFTS